MDNDYSSHVGAQHFLGKLKAEGLDQNGVKGLVVGFGEGHEAEYLQRNTKTSVYGIDIRSRIPKNEVPTFNPVLASAMDIPYKSFSFDYVFFHHVIEHVPDPVVALNEIYRLLVPGGLLFIGTPNRHRIIGYMGAYKISLRRKIRNNLVDFKYRLMGKFRNEYGAHAGFSRDELTDMLVSSYTNINWLTKEFLVYKYQRRLPPIIMKFILYPSIMEFAAPSIYVLCRKA